jgi:Co/Zn/Cd efflux system component
MAACCNDSVCSSQMSKSPRYRKILWISLFINAFMFGVELTGGLTSDSVSLLADAVDFAGDAANYGISLAVLSMSLAWRSRAALIKGISMTAYGVFVISKTVIGINSGVVPEAVTMGGIAILALIANGSVAAMLYAFRDGDANMRSVWLCSRNDALINMTVLMAAGGVFGTNSNWPDLVVAGFIASLTLSSGISVIRQARKELGKPPMLNVPRVEFEK